MARVDRPACPSCGARLDAKASVCDVCGTAVAGDSPPAGDDTMRTGLPPERPITAYASQDSRPPLEIPGPRSRKRFTKIPVSPPFFFVLATVLTLAAGIVGYMIGHLEKGSPPGSTPPEEGIVDRETLVMLEEMRSAVERNPRDTQAVLRYANALHDTKRIDEAIAQYKAYLALKPDDPDAGIDLGVCYFEKRDFEAAASQMRSVLTRHPRHQLGAYNFGIVLMHTGRVEEARDWLRKAVEVDPGTAVAENARRVLENLEREPG